MQWAKTAHRAPRQIAEILVRHLQSGLIAKTEIAGAGFINIFLAAQAVYDNLKTILNTGADYGSLPVRREDTVLVEYVSANPTGPLHVGHAGERLMGAPWSIFCGRQAIRWPLNIILMMQAIRLNIWRNRSMPVTSSCLGRMQKCRRTDTGARTLLKQRAKSKTATEINISA